MSRRGRHGRHGHPGGPRPGQLPAAPAPERAPGVVDAYPLDSHLLEAHAADQRRVEERRAAPVDLASTGPVPAVPPESGHSGGNGVHAEPVAAAVTMHAAPHGTPAPAIPNGAPAPATPGEAAAPAAVRGPVAHGAPNGAAPSAPDGSRTTCTTAQLRRFIKSRPWVPMHELRRRFGIWGADDDVTPIRVGDQTLFIGLPEAEGRMVGELLSGGDVGYELSLDPGAPIVVGVYPMRPVPRS